MPHSVAAMGRPKRAAASKAKAGDDGEGPSTKKAKAGLAVGDMLPAFTAQTDEATSLSSEDMVSPNAMSDSYLWVVVTCLGLQ